VLSSTAFSLDCITSAKATSPTRPEEQTEWNIELFEGAWSRLASDYSLIKNLKIELMAEASGSGGEF
jgi:hypothetical protein